VTLSALMKKGALRGTATAIPATAATDDGKNIGTVARVATVAVANPRSPVADYREQVHHIAPGEELLPRAWVVEEVRDGENLRAVKICSAVLEDHLWLIFDRSFEPKDGLAIYYPEELATIAAKSPEELREIHKVKLKFPGCRVIQEGAEVSTPER
jgi:hypothetical protein